MANQTTDIDHEARQQNFERVLAREPFHGLKAILDKVCPDRKALCEAVGGAASYEDLLGRLGYRTTLIPQIHINDAFSRVGPAGGIRYVLPYHDIPTQSSLPTLVNFDSTVTTTPKAASFFNEGLTALKKQWNTENSAKPSPSLH